MYTGLLHLHSTLRWVILILLIIMIIRAFAGRSGGRVWSDGDRKVALFTLIASHITLLVGLYQWAMGPKGLQAIQINGMADTMKNGISRFYAVEHPVGMIAAILMITLAYGFAKKEINDVEKYNKLFRYYAIALVILLAMIPWPFREAGANLSWFPGM